MDGVSYVYHKSIESAVKKYALCSNPRDGAVSRTYFPPSSYELSQQSAFIHKELNRRAGFQRRKIQTVIDSGRQETSKREKSSKLPPIRLSERILDDYEPGKVFQESILPNHQSPRFNEDKALALASLDPIKQYLAPLKSLGKKRGKSEMQLRFEMEEEYISRMRLNKKLTNNMSHRMERFYYLQGGMANLSKRDRNDLSLFPPSLNTIHTVKENDVSNPGLISHQNTFITQQNTERELKSPITHVITQNIDQQIITPRDSESMGTALKEENSPERNWASNPDVPLENPESSAVVNDNDLGDAVNPEGAKLEEAQGVQNDAASLETDQDNLDDSRLSLAEAETKKESVNSKVQNPENEEDDAPKEDQSETNSIDDPKEMPFVQDETQNVEAINDSKGDDENPGGEVAIEDRPGSTVETPGKVADIAE